MCRSSCQADAPSILRGLVDVLRHGLQPGQEKQKAKRRPVPDVDEDDGEERRLVRTQPVERLDAKQAERLVGETEIEVQHQLPDRADDDAGDEDRQDEDRAVEHASAGDPAAKQGQQEARAPSGRPRRRARRRSCWRCPPGTADRRRRRCSWRGRPVSMSPAPPLQLTVWKLIQNRFTSGSTLSSSMMASEGAKRRPAPSRIVAVPPRGTCGGGKHGVIRWRSRQGRHAHETDLSFRSAADAPPWGTGCRPCFRIGPEGRDGPRRSVPADLTSAARACRSCSCTSP